MKNQNITFVTGIWDLKRSEAQPGWNRSFEHYIECFEKLLVEMKDHNLFIYIDPEHEHIVWKNRDRSNTFVVHHTKEQFNGHFFPFFDRIQEIRNKEEWYGQAGWLKDSTQGSMEYYNPMVMSKMFMLNNARISNPFNSKYMYWIDGGISNTCSPGYFNDKTIVNNIKKLSNKLLFICFPYETESEIHGFDIGGMRKYANHQNVNRVARGGFFGGNIEYIGDANCKYYELLHNSLEEGYMGTEESIFTIMTYLDPVTYKFEMIEGNGLIYKFFEDLKIENFTSNNISTVNLYIITYNAPRELRVLLESFEKYEPAFLTETNLILINNSTRESCAEEYDMICEKYQIDQHKFNNIGICGGRQWAAEHFEESGAEFSIFFEDDMTLDLKGTCSCGFTKNVKHLLSTSIEIMKKERYDFLKMCFTEFFGNNSEQWAWNNLPADKKVLLCGEKQTTRPNTKYHTIKIHDGTAYAEGEVYYCNWPHIMSKEGNQKCFLDTKWAHPYEQTWMSHIFQLTREGQIRPGILLASPITHERITHYGKEERREN